MRVVICYIVVTQGVNTLEWASRFATTYRMFRPGADHDLLLCCNGGPVSTQVGLLFEGLNATFWPRENDPGWDVTAYISAARGPAADADLIICLGETCYFHRENWLPRLLQAHSHHGMGMYGFFSSNVVRPHMNTTGFAANPVYLRDYPLPIRTRGDRYEFEHGLNSFWKYVRRRAGATKLVTWDGEWEPFQWRMPANILWRGDQSNCLLWCNHSDAYVNADPNTRSTWARMSDQPSRELL